MESAENAFIQVTAFVGAVLLIFGYINYIQSGRLIENIEESKKVQPIIGSLLGLIPGCGSAIFVVPLFPKGTGSFGTVIATLIATMGDSAFVLMSVMPFEFVIVSIISFVVAIITGYIVDRFDIGHKLRANIESRRKDMEEIKSLHEDMDHSIQTKILDNPDDEIPHIGHEEGDEIDLILHHQIKGHQDRNTLGYRITHKGFSLYWIVIAIGLILGIMDIFQIDLNDLFIPNLGSIIGVAGTLLSIVMMIASKKFLGDDTHEESELKTLYLRETIVHNAQETAFIGTWVFVAYFVYELFVLLLGGGNYMMGENLITAFLSQTGLVAVILGVLVGMIPGCGPQIIFVSLYTRGMLPFAALLANAISQDGDALFPLIAIDRKSAVWATILTTIPAFIAGILVYIIEINFF